MTEACIVSWAHTNFGKLEDPDVESLIACFAEFFARNYSIAYVARPQRVRGGCFSFLRHIARWTQEALYPFDRLTYVALGISRDGRWCAAETTPTAVTGQPAAPRGGRSSSHAAALTRRIATEPKALSPGIAALDAVATSLAVPCGTP